MVQKRVGRRNPPPRSFTTTTLCSRQRRVTRQGRAGSHADLQRASSRKPRVVAGGHLVTRSDAGARRESDKDKGPIPTAMTAIPPHPQEALLAARSCLVVPLAPKTVRGEWVGGSLSRRGICFLRQIGSARTSRPDRRMCSAEVGGHESSPKTPSQGTFSACRHPSLVSGS